MAKRELILNEAAIAELKAGSDRSRERGEIRRMQAVRLYGMGHPVEAIAEVVDVSIPSIYRWAGAYKARGVEGLLTKKTGNQNAAKLSREQKADLREKLHRYRPGEVLPPQLRVSQGQFWTVSDLKVAVRQWYGVSYRSDLSYRELLKSCDFSLQRTSGQYRSRASQEAIADFEEGLEKK